MDFSSPEKMPFPEFDLMDIFKYKGALEPVEWTKDGDFIFKLGKEEMTLSREKLLAFLNCDKEENDC